MNLLLFWAIFAGLTLSNSPDVADSAGVVNATELAACHELNSLPKESSSTQVLLQSNVTDNRHYLSSSDQASACVYIPHSPEDLAAGLRIIARRRIRYAVECSGHQGNPGFSSTRGIHISMHGFQDVKVSADKSYVDIGGGSRWTDVYSKLANTSSVAVLGGRAPGPGIGGFVTGGGGYSWLTSQYGLTGDSLISVGLVLPNGTLAEASDTMNSDLFWAIKGGGNQFGAIYCFRLKAFPRPAQVYGGIKTYVGKLEQAFVDAIANFALTNKDTKAQIIPVLNTAKGVPVTILIAYYDGVPEADPFPMFNETFPVQTFNSFIQSIGYGNLVNNNRGAFHTVSFQHYTPAVLAEVKNQTLYWGQQTLSTSGDVINFDIELFMPYSQHAKDAAWPHKNNAQPMGILFTWKDPAEDDFWHKALLETAAVIEDAARKDGQDIDSLYLYPNYALEEVPSERLYGAENLARLRELKQKWDPEDFTSLTTYFKF